MADVYQKNGEKLEKILSAGGFAPEVVARIEELEKRLDTRNPGELVYSLLPLEDAGLHLLDGSLLAADGMYAEFVALLSGLRSDYPGLFITENDWQSAVADYGVCGKFVYDEAAATLRLPKVTGFIEGTLDAAALGSLTEAGLPNITGQINPTTNSGGFPLQNAESIGALRYYSKGSNSIYGDATGNTYGIEFDASRSSPIYGNANTVQPQSIKGYLYIVLANRSKTPMETDIDNIAADMQLKADIDLSNVNTEGLETLEQSLLPRNEAEVLTSSGVWTAPESRFYHVTLVGGGGGGSGGFASGGSGIFVTGGNGGGSGYVVKFRKWYSAGTQITYTIGAGGAGGAAQLGGTGGRSGGTGGTTAFDGVSAIGGTGGIGAVSETSNTGSSGYGRINGLHGFYGIESVQKLGGAGGAGYSDLSPDSYSYGAGGNGGIGAASVASGLSGGGNGNRGAVFIQ